MDKDTKKALGKKLKVPFIVTLVGVLVMCIGVFLPYLTAVGEIAEYIERNPNRIESKELNLTSGDLKDVPLISVNKLIACIYGEDDGIVAVVIISVFGGFLALAALFTFLKKPVAIMIFDLLTCGAFLFLNAAMKEDFIDPDKYAWGIGYYAIIISGIAIFSGSIWMLVKKILTKRALKAPLITEPVFDTIAE